jgi:hypothetical protein
MGHDHEHQAESHRRLKNEIVAKDIQNLMKCLDNLNVKGNQERRLDVWCRIFSRLLEPDGKRLLCMQEKIRLNVKIRTHEALINYPDHPVGDFAKRINNFLDRFEYLGIYPEDINFDEQL